MLNAWFLFFRNNNMKWGGGNTDNNIGVVKVCVL